MLIILNITSKSTFSSRAEDIFLFKFIRCHNFKKIVYYKIMKQIFMQYNIIIFVMQEGLIFLVE